MGQVTVTLNGRAYRLSCGEGEEARLTALADHVRSKLDTLVAQFGQVGNDRLILMAALLIADELWDAKAKAAPAEGGKAAAPPPAEARVAAKDTGGAKAQKAAS